MDKYQYLPVEDEDEEEDETTKIYEKMDNSDDDHNYE